MGIKSSAKIVFRNLVNFPGWYTRRKIVVIESDDWGSIRMPSKEVFKRLLGNGIYVDKLSYNRYDSLASEKDLSELFEILTSVKDKNGNYAILTANTIVANPDFDKIRESGYQQYFYEPFTETLKRYLEHTKSFELWQQGMREGILKPQFHGREHLNVHRWMRALKENTGEVRLAFNLRMFDLSTSLTISENSFMEAFNFESSEEFEFQRTAIIEGSQLFEDIFGFRSKTFIAPCYTWSNQISETLKNNGIEALQGSWYQFEPIAGKEHRFKKRFHYTGQKNYLGQVYLVRNAFFEPAENQDFDWVSEILSRAQIAFRWGKPLIISSHRLNYIGFIESENRERNLILLKKLLMQLKNKWPDIEFMSSDALAMIIQSKLQDE